MEGNQDSREPMRLHELTRIPLGFMTLVLTVSLMVPTKWHWLVQLPCFEFT